jgi:hypothetical protein
LAESEATRSKERGRRSNGAERGREFKWKAPTRSLGRRPLKPQTALLPRRTSARRNGVCSHDVPLGQYVNVESNKWSNKKLFDPKCLRIKYLSKHNIALLRRWLWVRAPPNPNISFDFESPRSHYRSHSVGGAAQSNEQFHTVACCYLLPFFWVILADLTHLTAVWCTSRTS